jgi:Arm DNA-binding domain
MTLWPFAVIVRNARVRLTVGWLDSPKDRRNRPKDRREETVDGHEGLMAWVYPSGEVVFVFRYTGANGKRRKTRRGQYGDGGIKLAEAFDLHCRAKHDLEKGLDPIEERERRQGEAEKARQHRAAADAVTVHNVIADWGWWYARRERKAPTGGHPAPEGVPQAMDGATRPGQGAPRRHSAS